MANRITLRDYLAPISFEQHLSVLLFWSELDDAAFCVDGTILVVKKEIEKWHKWDAHVLSVRTSHDCMYIITDGSEEKGDN